MVKLRDVRRTLDIEQVKSKNHKQDAPEDDLDFMLWKTELNKELLSFWKSLQEKYSEEQTPCEKN